MKRQYRLRFLAVFLCLFLFACVCNFSSVLPQQQEQQAASEPSEPPAPEPTEAPPPTQTPLPPTITEIPAATPVSVATARPLTETEPQDGVYINDVQGISLNYPTSWEVLEQDYSSYFLLWLSTSDYESQIYLFSDFVPEDSTFDEYSKQSLDDFLEALEVTTINNIEYGLEYTLPSGEIAWHGRGDGIERSGYAVTFDMFSVGRGSRIFEIVAYRFTGYSERFQDQSESIIDSVEVFEPRPYGVARDNALFLNGSEPDSFDPAKWLGSADSFIGDIYSGLVRLDASLQPIPDLATHWDVSEDGTVYTFYLHTDVRFHDGKPFAAEDVLFSWEHALDPATESITALTYLGDIVGTADYADGKTRHIAGVRLIDDYTIEITLDAPKVYFLSKLSYPVSWIVDSDTIDQIDEHPNGTGPFRFVRHDENEVLILERNADYHLHPVALEYIVYMLIPAPGMQMYETGDIDIVEIDRDFLSRAEDPGDPLYGNIHEANDLCTYFLVFNSSKPPFDDPAVRRAFAMAVDKHGFNEKYLDGQGVVADGLFPPGLPGYNPDIKPLGYDADAAVQALADSTYSSADALPPISLTTVTAGGSVDPELAFFLASMEDVLGVSVAIDSIDYDSYEEIIYSGNYKNLLFWGWCADYADPENFADILFHSESAQNIGGYSNPEVDDLLEEARTIPSVEDRLALYQVIEQMLVDDAAAVFIYHSEAYYIVTRKGLEGYRQSPVGIAQNMNLSFSDK
jgi:oligopeptide transport system substrate-binding protein